MLACAVDLHFPDVTHWWPAQVHSLLR